MFAFLKFMGKMITKSTRFCAFLTSKCVHGLVSTFLVTYVSSYEYGPCVGMTRVERWERADALGLSPPKEVSLQFALSCLYMLTSSSLQIYEILLTKQGLTLDEYKHSVFTGEV